MAFLTYQELIDSGLNTDKVLKNIKVGFNSEYSKDFGADLPAHSYPFHLPKLTSIDPKSFLSTAGLKVGDELVSIGNFKALISDNSHLFIDKKYSAMSSSFTNKEFYSFLMNSSNNEVEIVFMRPIMSSQKVSAAAQTEFERIVVNTKIYPLFEISNEEQTELLLKRDISLEIKKEVFNQDLAIDAINESIILYNAGLKDDDKPIGSFLLAGPTGVGKTEVAKLFAKEIGFKFLRIDMSEYSSEHNSARIVGPPPGYLGYDQPPVLQTAIGKTGNQVVVLLDEIEKAHPSIHKLFLQAMDNGIITLGNGEEVNFRNCLILMTSNAGIVKSSLKLDMDLLKDSFPPEFIGRLDGVLEFNKLNNKSIDSIVKKFIKSFEAKLAKQSVELTFTEKALDLICKKGFSVEYGARGIKNTLKKEVYIEVAKLIIKTKNCKITVDSKDNKLVFTAVDSRVAKLSVA